VVRTAVVEEQAEDDETREQADAALAGHLRRLAAAGVPATGAVLRAVGDSAAVGRALATHARSRDAAVVVVGGPTSGGLGLLADGSVSRTLQAQVDGEVVVVGARDAVAS